MGNRTAIPTWLMKVTTSLLAAADQTAWGLHVAPHLADLTMVRLLQLRPCRRQQSQTASKVGAAA